MQELSIRYNYHITNAVFKFPSVFTELTDPRFDNLHGVWIELNQTHDAVQKQTNKITIQ